MIVDVDAELERVARLSYGRLVARLASRTGHLQDAEDALGDAIERALSTWPRTGIPAEPEAWLLVTATRRGVDGARRRDVASRYAPDLALLESLRDPPDESTFPDDVLKLLFVCAHPSIERTIRAPLMLQTVLGLDVRRMAGMFLLSPNTLGQRLTRAKAKIAAARISFVMPSADALPARLEDVLAAIYAAYSVGADGAARGDGTSAALGTEALWLIGLLCRLLPKEPEAHGLFALMLFGEARRGARRDAHTGAFVPLEAQETGQWDAALLRDADQALANAARHASIGRFQLEASIQAAHMARRHGGATDWSAIELLYEGLVRLSPTVGALTGRAVALSETRGPRAGLEALDAIEAKRIATYQPWWTVRAHLLASLGEHARAIKAYDRAIGLTEDAAVCAWLTERRRYTEVDGGGSR